MRLRFGFLVILLLLAGLLRPSAPAQGEAFVVQTDMYGSQTVPPVKTIAYGFVRFFFDETRRSADYTVDVKGLSGTLVLGADIHRGQMGRNGPVVKHLADGGFIVTSGRLRLSQSDLEEMLSGNWYVVVRSQDNPEGEMRGQIALPPDFLPRAAPQPPQGQAPVEATEVEAQPTAELPAPAELPLPGLEAQVPPAAPEPPRGEVRILPPNTGDAGLKR